MMNGFDYLIDLERFDFDRIHSWLTHSYWSPGITRQRVEQGFQGSTVCVGAFLNGRQIGVARCISDTTRFAYVADVFVQEDQRRKGVARELVRQLMEHPRLTDVESWYLLTRDAHSVYAGLGFTPHPRPQDLMRLVKPGK
ncbi:MAG TPA: GNAT family N-acetyltransferase [Roseimicrobium sp.]|nr:GNAT family N-acetyltransferase [Roseimicrobium sp.]